MSTPASSPVTSISASPGLLEAAIIGMNATGGGTLSLEAGTFISTGTAQIQATAPINIVGSGIGVTIIVLEGGSNAYLNLTGNGSRIEGLTIQRGNSTVSRLCNISGAYCEIADVFFDGQGATYTGEALNVTGNDLNLEDCVFSTINGYGMSVNSVAGLTVKDNRWVGHLGSLWPISLNTNVTDFKIRGNKISSDPSATAASVGIYTSLSGDATLSGVVSENLIHSATFAIVVQQTAAGTRPGRIAITGNQVTALVAGYGGFSLSGADSCTVTGNVIDMSGLASATGIELDECTHCTVTGNEIIGTGGVTTGIFLIGSSQNTVTGNDINGFSDAAGAAGIRVYASSAAGQTLATDNTITGNHVYFPAAAAGTSESGISLDCNGAGGFVDRNVVVGNTIVGNGVASSHGIEVTTNGAGGSATHNLIGMNIISGCATDLYQSGDTSTLISGTTWNQLV